MRKKKATPRGHINPMAWMSAMMGAAALSRDDQTVWALQFRAALDAVRQARATRSDWQVIVDAANLAEQLVRMRLAADPDGVISRAQQACAAVLQRWRERKIRAARAEELAALYDLEGAMIDLQASITQSQRYAAQRAVAERAHHALAGQPSKTTLVLPPPDGE